MERKILYFTAPRQVAVRSESLSEPTTGQVLVRAQISAISAGTELLFYRGQFPGGLAVDDSLPVLAGEFQYPLSYGYSTVGQVIALGPGVDAAWLDRRVFAFQPHASHFLATPDELMLLSDDLSEDEAVFLPTMETAVNLVMDGAPLLGERVAIFGQGLVGLLTTSLLSIFPLSGLVTLDRHTLRRQASVAAGAQASLDPDEPETLEAARRYAGGDFDLVYELSGEPQVLENAIAVTGFAGRVVIGSWYGEKRAPLDLGGRFHRSRIHLISSQVSSLAPNLCGRWDKPRRFQVAWEMLRRIRPAPWITHRFPLSTATEAYRLLDERPGEALQVVFSSQD